MNLPIVVENIIEVNNSLVKLVKLQCNQFLCKTIVAVKMRSEAISYAEGIVFTKFIFQFCFDIKNDGAAISNNEYHVMFSTLVLGQCASGCQITKRKNLQYFR